MKLLLIAGISVFVAACAGNPAAIRQAEQQCRAQGLAPASPAFVACVDDVTETIYKSWGRDRLSKGD